MSPYTNPSLDMVPIWLRYLLEHDLAAVMRIERASSSYPRTQAEFVEWLRPPTRVGLIAGTQNLVVGYIIYEQNFHRLDLLDFVVEPGCRGRGIGHQMMAKMLDRLDLTRRTHLACVVNERNVVGQLFLRNEGFRWVETLCDHYPGGGGGEDGYRFLRARDATGPVPIGPSGKEILP
jgi:ribosomal protein S18 acetylase RimI-like enzyme